MIKADHYLKPAWVRRQFELAQPLLPPGSSMALQLGGKRLVEMNEAGRDLTEGTQCVQTFPLALEGEQVGMLLLGLPTTSAIARAQGELLAHALQGMLESEHGRRAVARETLESYREMALLQRAVTDLNHSLKPAAVVAALLKEFDGSKSAVDFGAVFLYDADSGGYDLERCCGEGAEQIFDKFKSSALFAEIATHETGDIINDLPSSPLWDGDAADFQALLWLPLISHGEKLGLLVLVGGTHKRRPYVRPEGFSAAGVGAPLVGAPNRPEGFSAADVGAPLVGARNRPEGFSAADLKRAQTLSSVAVTALRNAQLYAAEQQMFQSFVKVIATAIDAKSPYTAGHCRRVPEIALMIAEAAHQADSAPLKDFVLDEDRRNAMEIAAMLHDCGKVVTPEWVVDKATKLDCIANRIHLVAMRFEVLRRDAAIDYCRALAEGAERESVEATYRERLGQLDDDFAFLEKCNLGGEFISAEHLARIESIARQRWRDAQGASHPLLSENEIYNLSIQRGTLNPEERKIIEDHAVHTINMLSQISFPQSLRNVTEYAAGHHERMDGTGYPRGLKRDQLSIPARIIAIADIFEALTAPDRPYRKPGKLSWAIDIMHRMKLDNHIDGDLFDLFISKDIYLAYAQTHLAANQIDEVDTSRYLGREP